MELDENELENISAGYSTNNNLENAANLIFSRELIRHIGGGPMTFLLEETVAAEFKQIGINYSEDEINSITNAVNERIEHHNQQLTNGR